MYLAHHSHTYKHSFHHEFELVRSEEKLPTLLKVPQEENHVYMHNQYEHSFDRQ